MKKDLLFSCFVLLITICFSTANFTQNNLSSTGKAPASHQISDLTHIKITEGSITFCRYIYYYDATTSIIGRLSYDGGCPGGDLASWTPPTDASAGVQGGNGNFYILVIGSPNSLCQLDTSNGNVTILGPITGMGGISANGIAYNVINDSYYLCGQNNLYNLDINTLNATLISSISPPGSVMIAIAINSSGVGYGYTTMNDNNAYTFDPVTGVSTLLGPIGFNALYAQDMDIDIQTSMIYLAAFNVDLSIGELRTMDPNTGMTTLISPLFDEISVFEFDNGYNITPVELNSFVANLRKGNVILQWSTSTETNNQGFEVQRKSGNTEFEKIGFFAGSGSTTEPKAYSFVDKKLDASKYTYRLKQIDFNGSFNYSNTIDVEINTPSTFSLEQNFPNPFNPSTKIKFTIPQEVRGERRKLSLKVYDILGNEIASLVNEELTAGEYEVEFDGANLISGIYFYELKAGSFIQTKKMVLMK
jgi:hypothetical protein